MQYTNGRQGMVSSLQPRSVKSYISPHPDLGFIDPLQSGLETHFCKWRSQRSSSGCGGTRAFPVRSTFVCLKHSAGRLWTLSEWSLTWSAERTETHFWCCTGPLYAPSWTMVALCMAQHQIPIYDNWTAFTTLDWDWHWEHSVPAQYPDCTQRLMKLLWRNVSWSYPCITIWKLVPALTIEHIMPGMNLTEPLEICMPPGQIGEGAWPDLQPL